MKKVKEMYYGLWDNYRKGSPERIEVVDEVLEAVLEHGEVDVSFGYTGRTRHELASWSMMEELKARGYDFESRRDGYYFTIYRDKN